MTGEPLRRRVRARALRGLSGLAGHLPQRALARALELTVRAAPTGRYARLVDANLELALGGETTALERRAIAHGVRRHAARQLAEWLRLARAARSPAERAHQTAWLEHLVTFDDSIAILDELRAAGRGVLVVTAHLGNWEVLALALHTLRGHPGAVVGRTRARDSASRFLVDLRSGFGLETIPQDAAARRLLEVPRRGGTLGLLTDLEVRRLHGIFVPFFGTPALTMTAPAALARAAGLPLLPVRCVARDDGYRLSVDEPLELDRGLERREATRDLCERTNRVFERWIRADPEQWAWHQPRWRTRAGQREIVPLAFTRAVQSRPGGARPGGARPGGGPVASGHPREGAAP